MSTRIIRILILVVVVAALAAGASQILAGKPGGGGCPKPRANCFCPEVYDPVTCDGGCTYSNSCFAGCAGATNCVPSGGGPIQ